MKKTIIAAVGAICMSVGFANAEDVVVAFDGPGSKSVNVYVTASLSENNETQKVPVPQAVTRTSVGSSVNPYKDNLVLVKDLLKDLSSRDRVEFMSSIKLINGRVDSQGYTVLERNGMSSARIDEILLAFEHQEEDINSHKPGMDRPIIQVGELLQGVPEKVKEDLFDNMKLLNGAMVSIKTNALEKAIAPERFEEILNIIMPTMKSATRVKDEACNASTGAKGKAVLRGCDYQVGYTCNPSTCK